MILNKMEFVAKCFCKITFFLGMALANVTLANASAQTTRQEQPIEALVSELPAIVLAMNNSNSGSLPKESSILPYNALIPHANNESILIPFKLSATTVQYLATPMVPHEIKSSSTPFNVDLDYPVSPFTQANIRKAVDANQKFIHKSINSNLIQQVNTYKPNYQTQFQTKTINRFKMYSQYWQNSHYLNWYSNWYKWGFYGGYRYPVRPYFAIENYSTYPLVQMFFMDIITTPEYFRTYYNFNTNSNTAVKNRCLEVSSYKHIYFPTNSFLYLLIDASSFSKKLLCNFRTAIDNFHDQLQQEISSHYTINFSLQPNDLVVNYYINLQNKAILLVGFVNQNKINIAFETLLDLEKPHKSFTFVPKGNLTNDLQLQKLYQLNKKIAELGGDPFSLPLNVLLENGKKNKKTGFQKFLVMPR